MKEGEIEHALRVEAEVARRRRINGRKQFQSEQDRLDQALLATLLHRVVDALIQKDQMVLRKDIERALNQATVTPLAGLDSFSAQRIAKRVWEDSSRVYQAMNVQEFTDGLQAAVLLCLRVGHDHLVEDGDTQPFLISALLVNEWNMEGGAGFRFEPKTATVRADRGLKEAQSLGYFLEEGRTVRM